MALNQVTKTVVKINEEREPDFFVLIFSDSTEYRVSNEYRGHVSENHEVSFYLRGPDRPLTRVAKIVFADGFAVELGE